MHLEESGSRYIYIYVRTLVGKGFGRASLRVFLRVDEALPLFTYMYIYYAFSTNAPIFIFLHFNTAYSIASCWYVSIFFYSQGVESSCWALSSSCHFSSLGLNTVEVNSRLRRSHPPNPSITTTTTSLLFYTKFKFVRPYTSALYKLLKRLVSMENCITQSSFQ